MIRNAASVRNVASARNVASVRNVAIIGAGAAGLVTARELIGRGITPTVFEATSEVGGLWNYQELARALDPTDLDVRSGQKRVRSPLYPSLRTNLPRRLMAFRDFRFDDPEAAGEVSEALRRDFPGHAAVRRYLIRFAKHFELYRWIQFGTRVEHVDPGEAGQSFRVSTSVVADRSVAEAVFDAVAVCNGHYSEPNVPEFVGLEAFPGAVLHSHVYRGPDPFAGTRVLVVGAASSGLDLCHELSSKAAQVFLSAFEPATISVDDPIELRAEVSSLHGDGSVALVDGSKLERIDVVLLCTGYRYRFSFLSKGLVQVAQGNVRPLYLDLFHVDLPRLAFVGLPFKVVPFPQFEIQAKVFARYLSGSLELPDRAERQRAQASNESERRARNEKPRHALRHGARQFGYYERLASLIGEPPLPDWFEPLYDEVSQARRDHPRDYRDVLPRLRAARR